MDSALPTLESLDELLCERPSLDLRAKLRRHAGAMLVDGIFLGASKAGRYTPLASARLHDVEIIRDIRYQASARAEHVLDIYRPKQRKGPLPMLLYVHGGGFRILSKDTHWIFGLRFARAGYVVANISYRLAPENRFPAAVQDACAAFQWVVQNAADYGGDVSRLVITGESAGANLATGLAVASCYRRPEPWAQAVFETGVVPKAVVPACGVLQVSDPERYARGPGASPFMLDRLAEIADAYLTGVRVPARNGLDLADPVVALERGEKPERPLPAFFIPCGTGDALIDDSKRLHVALQRLGAVSEARWYPRQPHSFHAFPFLPNAIRCWRDKLQFLRRHVA